MDDVSSATLHAHDFAPEKNPACLEAGNLCARPQRRSPNKNLETGMQSVRILPTFGKKRSYAEVFPMKVLRSR